MKQADVIRKHVFDAFIVPARKSGAKHVDVVSGDVGRNLKIEHLMPAVCGALGTNKFENEYAVESHSNFRTDEWGLYNFHV